MDPLLPAEPLKRLRWFQTQNPRTYARVAAKSKSPRFFGAVMPCGVLFPKVPPGNELCSRIGMYALPGSNSASPYDEKLIAAATRFCEIYNPELLRCLIAQNHPEVRRARQEALQELQLLLSADPTSDARKVSKGHLYFMSVYGYTPETPGCKPKPDYAGFKYLKAFPTLLRGREHDLLACVVQRYVIPYNRYLLTHRKP